MVQVKLLELIRDTGDSADLNPEDKLLVAFDDGTGVQRVSVPGKDINDEKDVEDVLKEAALKKRESRQVINLTKQWKGVYEI